MITRISLWCFSLFRHPLILVGTLTLQRVPALYIVLTKSSSSWIAYLLFLIFLGGLLIIFVYLSALIPNEIFTPSQTKIIITLVVTRVPVLWSLNMLKFENNPHRKNPINDFSSVFFHNIFIFILIYLFVCLSSTIYITSKYKTPIKNAFYDQLAKKSPLSKNYKLCLNWFTSTV